MYVEKRNGLGNRFTENWVIKFLRGSDGKLLICFQTNFFAFPRTWLPSYVSLDEGHVFSFLNLSFSMQIKSFPWALSSDKREFSSENVWFFVAYWYISYCLSHPYEISMQIVSEYALPHILDTSMEVFDRFFYWVKNWLRQWKSRISGDRVIYLKVISTINRPSWNSWYNRQKNIFYYVNTFFHDGSCCNTLPRIQCLANILHT